MKVKPQVIIDNLDKPHHLEKLYQDERTGFVTALAEALKVRPDSQVLRVWEARLLGAPGHVNERNVKPFRTILSIVTITFLLLTISSSHFDAEWYYPRYTALWVSLSMAIYFWIHRPDTRVGAYLIIVTSLTVIYLGVLPNTSSDSVLMALVHISGASVVLPAMVFLRRRWRQTDACIELLERAGEWFVICSLLVLGGSVFTAFTLGLYEIMDLEQIEEDWIIRNVGNVGIVTIPVVGMYLYDSIFRDKLSIAPVLARTFSPLFLLMISSYLIITLFQGYSPFYDRQFLIILNGLLLVVLGMTVYSVLARPLYSDSRWSDWISFGLLTATLLINVLVLVAITFRWYSFGITPNRMVITGLNIIVFVHFVWLTASYVPYLMGRRKITIVRKTIVSYLPIYVGWAMVIGFLFPLFVNFE